MKIEIDDFEHGGEPRGAIEAGGDFEGNVRFGERALGAHDALRDGGLRSEKGAGDLRRGEAAEQAKGERDARLRREHGMAGDEDEAEQIVFDVAVGSAGERGGEVGEGALLLFFQLAGELFVLALDARVAAQQIDGAMLGGGHEPRAGILRHAGLRPLLECGDQRVLRQLFGDADIAHDARQAGDDARRLHAPHGVDGAIDLAAVDVSEAPRNRSDHLSQCGCKRWKAKPEWRSRGSFKHGADLEFGFRTWATQRGAALHPGDGFFSGGNFDDVDAGDQFVGFGKRTIDGAELALGHPKARGVGAGLQALHSDQDASLAHLIIEALHGGHELGIRRPGFHPLLGFTQNYESQRGYLLDRTSFSQRQESCGCGVCHCGAFQLNQTLVKETGRRDWNAAPVRLCSKVIDRCGRLRSGSTDVPSNCTACRLRGLRPSAFRIVGATCAVDTSE